MTLFEEKRQKPYFVNKNARISKVGLEFLKNKFQVYMQMFISLH
ncbi:hypothetical protein PI172_1562 [Prevotella intermedia]|uniref:Uncharacterized protein n=1 Tax=Prevotella intermedia TaxID=28131 RepID=A0AAD1F7K4_PREIN|nr:hypothetical protein PI172_1562 [Prevotella intermedia]